MSPDGNLWYPQTCSTKRQERCEGKKPCTRSSTGSPIDRDLHLFGALGQRTDVNSITRYCQQTYSHLQETEYRRHKASSACLGQKSIRAASACLKAKHYHHHQHHAIRTRIRTHPWNVEKGVFQNVAEPRPLGRLSPRASGRSRLPTTGTVGRGSFQQRCNVPSVLGVHTGVEVRLSMRDY